MEKIKVIIDGKEEEIVTKLDEDMYEVNDDLEDTIDLSEVIREGSKYE